MKITAPPQILSTIESILNLNLAANKNAYAEQVQSVGIIGCGWLGTALAHSLLALGTQVCVTTRSQEKLAALQKEGLSGELLDLSMNDDEHGIDQHDIVQHIKNDIYDGEVFKQQQLVICITPQFKSGKKCYAQRIQRIVDAAQKQIELGGALKRIILISTTGVYKNLVGEISEDTVLDFIDEKVSALLKAEQTLKVFPKHTAIVRFAGLVGPKRHPGRFLAGKTGLLNSDDKVNLIHQYDAVGILLALLFKQEASGIFNGVSNTKTRKKEFYQQASLSLKLDKPIFELVSDQNKIESTKDAIVSTKDIRGEKVTQCLGYQFIYPDLSLIYNEDHLFKK